MLDPSQTTRTETGASGVPAPGHDEHADLFALFDEMEVRSPSTEADRRWARIVLGTEPGIEHLDLAARQALADEALAESAAIKADPSWPGHRR